MAGEMNQPTRCTFVDEGGNRCLQSAGHEGPHTEWDWPELNYTAPGLPGGNEHGLPRHGEPGHVCDGDRYPRNGDPNYKGPHVTDIIVACGSTTGEVRATCACGYLSRLLPSQQSARVAGWVHRRRVSKAPRVDE